MANPFHTYFGQVLTQVELNEIFDALFAGVDRFIQDFGYSGIVTGGSVVPHTPNNLTVDIEAPTVLYDQFANRIRLDTAVNVNLAVDENGASTAVAGSSNEKWLSIFVKFTSTPSQPATDDLGNTVYYRDVPGYKINVVQGSEAPIGSAVPAALRGDQILLADVKRGFATTAFSNASVSSTRSQTVIDLPGSPLKLKSKNLKDSLAAMLAVVNAAKSAVDTLDVDNLITDGVPGSPISIAGGPMSGALSTILAALNSLRDDVNEIHVPDVSNVARVNGINVFTARQAIEFSNASEALISTTSVPEDDSHPGNKWKLIFLLKHGGGRYVRIYTGKNEDDVDGAFAIVTNAIWDTAAQNWLQHVVTVPSQALIWHYGKLRLVGKPAGGGVFPDTAARWTDWGPGSFESQQSITVNVPIINAGFGAKVDPAGYVLAQVAGPSTIQLGVLLPRRAKLSGVLRVSHYQVDNAPDAFQLVKITVPYAPAGALTMSTVGPRIEGNPIDGYHTVTISLPADAIDPAAEYRILWTPGAVNNRVQGATIGVSVTGPD